MCSITKEEMRLIFLYEWKLQHNASEAARNINSAFGQHSTNDRTIRRWYAKFESGDETRMITDRGRPEVAIDNEELRTNIEQNPCQSVREIAKQFNVGTMTISRHLKEIGKVKKVDQWIPHLLNDSQKLKRFEICNSLLIRNKTDNFLHRIITCDEKWVLHNNRKRSAQWLDVAEAPKRFPKPDLYPKKTMITVWWSMAGLIHFSFLNAGETITSDKYCSEIELMHQKLCIKQPSLVNRKGVILLHDNARPHVSMKTLKKLSELNIEVLQHPPYSPDLAPTDYHFFKHLDKFLVQKTFADLSAIEIAISDFINSRKEDFYVTGIKSLECRWQKCVSSNGDYF